MSRVVGVGTSLLGGYGTREVVKMRFLSILF
jgi:hypothetical protein